LGQVSALNYGWSLCNGDIVGYLSSDDLLDNNAISRLVKKLTNDPSLSVVYGDFRLIDESGRKIRDLRTGHFNKRTILDELICTIGPGALFKKEILKQLKGWDKNYSYIADFVFWIRAIERYKFGKVNKVIASFRRHSASGLVRKISAKQSDEIIDFVRSHKSLNNNTIIS
jgi:glycosyltransferase involved in cell wall biosynthesis